MPSVGLHSSFTFGNQKPSRGDSSQGTIRHSNCTHQPAQVTAPRNAPGPHNCFLPFRLRRFLAWITFEASPEVVNGFFLRGELSCLRSGAHGRNSATA